MHLGQFLMVVQGPAMAWPGQLVWGSCLVHDGWWWIMVDIFYQLGNPYGNFHVIRSTGCVNVLCCEMGFYLSIIFASRLSWPIGGGWECWGYGGCWCQQQQPSLWSPWWLFFYRDTCRFMYYHIQYCQKLVFVPKYSFIYIQASIYIASYHSYVFLLTVFNVTVVAVQIL